MTICKRMSKPLLTLGIFLLLMAALTIPARAADYNGAKQALSDAMYRNDASVNLSAYGIPYEEFNDLYHEWEYKGSFPWYTDGCHYSYRNGIITTVTPDYWDPAEVNRQLYEQNVQRILKEYVLPDMSKWQIALSLYNYLAADVAYSEDYPPSGGIQRNAYGAIVNKDAVCVGYAHAYMDLLTRCGIPCIMVSSKDMNHTWNLVMISGSWYHVDPTWGDPLVYGKDAQGRVDHSYFLLSDAAISDSDHEHHGWERFYSCPDTFFDTGAFWTEINNHIWYMDDSVSFMRRSTNSEINIIRRDEYTGVQTTLCTITPVTVSISGKPLYYPNYGFSLWNGTLYFSDAANVYAISPAGGEAQVIYTYDCAANNKTILGSYVRDNTIFLTVKSPYNETSRLSVPLPYSYHSHSFAATDHEPTCMAQGYTAFTCSCGESFSSGKLDVVDHKEGQTYVPLEPTWNTAGTMTSSCIWCRTYLEKTLPALHTLSGSFGDVTTSDYFCESVLWAYVRGITSGTSQGVFSPYNTCTRAQVVTFLWRAMGSPEPTSTYEPFDDVRPTDWYYKPVLWALEHGITSGTGPTTFGSDAPCTRAQVVTFLWRTADSPAPMTPDLYPFIDVDPNGYYVVPMVWAVEQGITSGTSVGYFSPDAHCTRGQTVTFLRKYLVG